MIMIMNFKLPKFCNFTISDCRARNGNQVEQQKKIHTKKKRAPWMTRELLSLIKDKRT
ncbi:hypothetical protein BpHYR1_002679 [Brachionus plicatilis]|uniref:Uncharacterized protein n=1 Tax=Brachionus plicatilis TaxID=10195 RepID=A0A3M7R7W0_BRAPC|nr:hypothetical protein BpHYR1_002679 [Brachionus plicatilis]